MVYFVGQLLLIGSDDRRKYVEKEFEVKLRLVAYYDMIVQC